MNRPLASLLIVGIPLALSACGKSEATVAKATPEAAKEVVQQESKEAVAAAPTETVKAEEALKTDQPQPVAPAPAPQPASPYAVTDSLSGLGDFGSGEPIEREDLPERGVMSFKVSKDQSTFAPMEHWEQYNFPFQSKRWGRYSVRISYSLKSSTLGVQFKFGDLRLKKTLVSTSGATKRLYIGDIYIPQGGDQFMAFYTPNGVAWSTFVLEEVALVPTQEGEEVKPTEDGSLQLLAKDATTWSENMRYEPKPEKNCLGFWTEKEDFAEWEFTVDKAGKYNVTVHQGCGAGGGSEVAIQLGEQALMFKVQDTGGFQKWAPVNVGELEIKEPGTYRLAVKPQSKNGGAIMDVQKIILAPVS